jgi:hypothetical protein
MWSIMVSRATASGVLSRRIRVVSRPPEARWRSRWARSSGSPLSSPRAWIARRPSRMLPAQRANPDGTHGNVTDPTNTRRVSARGQGRAEFLPMVTKVSARPALPTINVAGSQERRGTLQAPFRARRWHDVSDRTASASLVVVSIDTGRIGHERKADTTRGRTGAQAELRPPVPQRDSAALTATCAHGRHHGPPATTRSLPTRD